MRSRLPAGRLPVCVRIQNSTRRREEKLCYCNCKFGRSCLLQEAAPWVGTSVPCGPRWDRWPKVVVIVTVHHVGVVHRRDDRSPDGLQRRPQAVACSLRRPWPARCAKASWTKPSRSRTATRRAIWPKSWSPVCRNSRRTSSARRFPAKRSKLPSAPWNAPRPSCTPN